MRRNKQIAILVTCTLLPSGNLITDAAHQPMGLAVGPDGSLYISDSILPTIWHVFYH
jgi:hypothetical protein